MMYRYECVYICHVYECKETETAKQQTAERDEEINATCVCTSACTTQATAHITFVQFQMKFLFFSRCYGTPGRRQHAHQTSMHCTTSITEIMPLLVAASATATATATATRNRRRTPLFLVLSPVVNCPLLFW